MRNISARNTLILLTVILLFPALFLFVDSLDLRFEEPRRAVVAAEMTMTGDYIVPHIHGEPYYNKPPLFNWAIAGLFKLTGSQADWLVRVPSLLALLLTGLLFYLFIARHYDKKVAALASLFFITSADIFFFGTLVAGEIDFFYMLIACIQVMAIYHFYQQKNYLLLFLVSYTFMVAGVLTKGFPSVLFQGMTLLLMVFWQKDYRLLFRWQHLAGLLAAIVLLYAYFAAYDKRGDLAAYITNLFNESSTKTGLGERKDKLLVNSLTFPVQMIRFLAPWSLLALFFFIRGNSRFVKANRVLVFCFLFILVNIPPYWFTGSVKSRYMYMFFPFIAVFLAGVYFVEKEKQSRWNLWTDRVMMGLMLVVTSAFVALPFLKALSPAGNVMLKSLFFFAAGATLVVLFRKMTQQRIWIFVLFIVMLRIAMGFYYIPLYKYREKNEVKGSYIAEMIIRHSGDQPVVLAGPPDINNIKAAIGPLVFNKAQIQTPFYLPYQATWYYTKYSGRILKFSPQITGPGFYIIREKDLAISKGEKYETEIVYSFVPGTEDEFHLVRVR